MYTKIFISHSSKQKPFVEKVVKNLGQDYTVVDKYTFESGQHLWTEIRNSIEKCDIFAYFISQEALESDWVKQEINFVRDLVDEEKVLFLPFIIDNKVNLQDVKAWIKKLFIVDYISSPNYLSRLLKRNIRREIWKKYPGIKEKKDIFIGREKEISTLSEDYYSEVEVNRKSLIISGLSNIGRKRLICEFLSQKVFTNVYWQDFIYLKLTANDSIDDFAIQLNSIVEQYTYDNFLDEIKDKEKTVKITVSLLNKLSEYKEHIVIDDIGCIVKGDGMLTKWFLDVLKNKNLNNVLSLNVASLFTPRPDLSTLFPMILNLQIQPLKHGDMKILFNAYSEQYDLHFSGKQVEDYIEKFAGYPEQVFMLIEILKNSNTALAARKIQNVISRFDNNFQIILSELKNDERKFQILILLSYFDFISYDYLTDICGEDISDVLEVFHYNSLTESFGLGKQFISLNSAVIDYIKRCKFKLSPEYKEKLKTCTRQALQHESNDISLRLHEIKELLRSGAKANEKYLVPSFVLKVITEEYHQRKNKNVISLADRILQGYNRKMYDDIERNITYWLCCALCREKDNRFFREVLYFDKESYSFYFLNGYYYRHIKKYETAKLFYQKALQNVNKYDADNYISKAEHELVLVYMNLGQYSEALDLAKQSYESNKSNTYHMEAYFRCLVRTEKPSTQILNSLINEMNHSLAYNKEIMVKTMQAEYKYYIEGKFDESVDLLRDIIILYKDNTQYPMISLSEICKRENRYDILSSIKRL